MYNLTCDESSAVDVGGIWAGPDEFELHFRFNEDDAADIQIRFTLSREELTGFISYLDSKLALQKLKDM